MKKTNEERIAALEREVGVLQREIDLLHLVLRVAAQRMKATVAPDPVQLTTILSDIRRTVAAADQSVILTALIDSIAYDKPV